MRHADVRRDFEVDLFAIDIDGHRPKNIAVAGSPLFWRGQALPFDTRATRLTRPSRRQFEKRGIFVPTYDENHIVDLGEDRVKQCPTIVGMVSQDAETNLGERARP